LWAQGFDNEAGLRAPVWVVPDSVIDEHVARPAVPPGIAVKNVQIPRFGKQYDFRAPIENGVVLLANYSPVVSSKTDTGPVCSSAYVTLPIDCKARNLRVNWNHSELCIKPEFQRRGSTRIHPTGKKHEAIRINSIVFSGMDRKKPVRTSSAYPCTLSFEYGLRRVGGPSSRQRCVSGESNRKEQPNYFYRVPRQLFPRYANLFPRNVDLAGCEVKEIFGRLHHSRLLTEIGVPVIVGGVAVGLIWLGGWLFFIRGIADGSRLCLWLGPWLVLLGIGWYWFVGSWLVDGLTQTSCRNSQSYTSQNELAEFVGIQASAAISSSVQT
jgi:hypothetical protein